jgi:glutaredoxin
VAALQPLRSLRLEGRRAATVVELYTSQGCSQCPRANRLLGMFSREDDVLALTFPVGIWDYLGWHDTFAQPEFAERQRAYSHTLRVRGRFTPQLVVNGARTISASDWDEARAIYDDQRAQAACRGAGLSLTLLRNGRARATIGSGSGSRNADIWMLAYDPGPADGRCRWRRQSQPQRAALQPRPLDRARRHMERRPASGTSARAASLNAQCSSKSRTADASLPPPTHTAQAATDPPSSLPGREGVIAKR